MIIQKSQFVIIQSSPIQSKFVNLKLVNKTSFALVHFELENSIEKYSIAFKATKSLKDKNLDMGFP